MAYVPPHKRVSQTQEGPPPTPARMTPHSKKSSDLNSSRRGSDRRTNKATPHGKKIINAEHLILRWLALPSTDDVLLPPSVCLAPVSLNSMGQKAEEKLLVLVNNDHLKQERNDIKSSDMEQTWASVAETVQEDLVSAFENLSNEQLDHNAEQVKPKLVARLGKVIFRWNPSSNRDFSGGNPVSKSYVKDLRRFFHTDVPMDYMEHVKNVVVPGLGVDFEEEKELYHVKLGDAKRPHSIISCKCRVLQDEKKLELYKIELNQLRHVILDISCLESDVDLRLALCTKETLSALQDEEVKGIREVISSAVIDSNVKGGLRWPLGKASTLGQYSIIGVWHTKTESYISSSIRLKIRVANRFDFLASTGEVTREVILRLKGMTRNLMEQGNDEAGGVLAIVKDALVLIRNHFLAWNGRIVSCSDS